MRYGLITPLDRHNNPGSGLITDGIKHWLRTKDPDAVFTNIDMEAKDPYAWHAAQSVDKIIFGGNPRFNSVETRVYWDWNIWHYILTSGKPFIDAWAGSACSFTEIDTPAKMADRLRSIKKNQDVLRFEAKAELAIARDEATYELCRNVANTVMIPCSTQWAKDEHNITPGEKKYNIICLRHMPGYDWILKKAAKFREYLKPCHVLVHAYNDFVWAKDLDPIWINDKRELLRFYSHADKVHCFRLHGSIPAHTLGAKVTYYYNDSRKDTATPFGIDTVPFVEFPKVSP